MKLYRPVGQKEYDLIKKSGFKKFPPRLDWQPFFYPVLNKEYAAQIASEWNSKDEFSDNVGYVLEFEVDDKYLKRFDIQTVGSSKHQEYWIPSEKLESFSSHIKGRIKVLRKYKLSHKNELSQIEAIISPNLYDGGIETDYPFIFVNGIRLDELLSKEDENYGTQIPILLCPDDWDFWCTVILVEVIPQGDKIIWNRFGTNMRIEMSTMFSVNFNRDKNEKPFFFEEIRWFSSLPPLTFDRKEYEDCKRVFEQWENPLREKS